MWLILVLEYASSLHPSHYGKVIMAPIFSEDPVFKSD